MKTIAAFYWDASGKFIVGMIIDRKTKDVRFGPKKWDCGDPNWAVFAGNASNAVNDFFAEIDKEITLGRQLELHFKLVSPSGPITHYGHTTGPGKYSAFIDGIFRANLQTRKLRTHRLRSGLTGDALADFKDGLKFAGVISSRNDAFKHRIWAVALKATRKTAYAKAYSVWEALKARGLKKRAAKQAFQGLLEQARSQR
jgi:hypothetical protein